MPRYRLQPMCGYFDVIEVSTGRVVVSGIVSRREAGKWLRRVNAKRRRQVPSDTITTERP